MRLRTSSVICLALALTTASAASAQQSSDGPYIVSDSLAPAPVQAQNRAYGASCPVAGSARVHDLVVHSTAANLDLSARVIVPSSWTPTSSALFPVLYLLGGHGNSHEAWTCATKLYEFVKDTGVMVVMPEAMWAYNRSRSDYRPDNVQDGVPTWYADWQSPAVTYNGKSFQMKAQTFHTQELRQLINSVYHGDDTRTAVAGLSMGGFGAMHYFALEPSRYVAAASFSGPIDSSYASVTFGGVSVSGVPEVIRASIDLKLGAGKADKLWGSINSATWVANNPRTYALRGQLNDKPLYLAAGEGGGTGPEGIDFDIFGFDTPEAGAYLSTRSTRRAISNPALSTQWLPDAGHNWANWNASVCRALKKTLLPALGVSAGVIGTITCPGAPAGTPAIY